MIRDRDLCILVQDRDEVHRPAVPFVAQGTPLSWEKGSCEHQVLIAPAPKEDHIIPRLESFEESCRPGDAGGMNGLLTPELVQ